MAAPLALAAPVFAQEATPAQETQVAGQARPTDELVCRTFALTGTRIEEEYCLTQEQWDEIREESREILERLMRTGSGA